MRVLAEGFGVIARPKTAFDERGQRLRNGKGSIHKVTQRGGAVAKIERLP